MRTLLPSPHATTSDETESARESARKLAQLAQSHDELTLSVQTRNRRESISVPGRAIAYLAEILETLASGRDVQVLPVDVELSTADAADLLNVSRPYLVKLLSEGAMPHRKVGTHRRIRLEDVLAYKARDDQAREAVLDQLAQEAQDHDMGYQLP